MVILNNLKKSSNKSTFLISDLSNHKVFELHPEYLYKVIFDEEVFLYRIKAFLFSFSLKCKFYYRILPVISDSYFKRIR